MHVRVELYSPDWPAAFQREAARLRPVCGKNLVALHHIGSTAVPGLAAKPILDIMPVVWELAAGEALLGVVMLADPLCVALFWLLYRYAFRRKSEIVDDDTTRTETLTRLRRQYWRRRRLLPLAQHRPCRYSDPLLPPLPCLCASVLP